jgi:predicted RNA-binding Zn ribbon-like protein
VSTTPAVFPETDEDLVTAVANTGHGDVDELGDVARVRAWWRELSGEATRDLHGEEQDLELLRHTRSVIRALALRNNGVDAEVDAAALAALPLRFTVTARPDLVVGARSNPIRDLTARTLAALLRTSADVGWVRVKACPGPDCGWVFRDRSRNGSRRWCDMAECGNRAKGAAFRARRRGRGPR